MCAPAALGFGSIEGDLLVFQQAGGAWALGIWYSSERDQHGVLEIQPN